MGIVRAMAPVHRDPHSGVLLVSSHSLVRTALDDPETFASATAPAGGDDQQAELAKQTIPFVAALRASDPPEHARLRGFAGEAFAPRRTNALVAELPKLCHALVDDFADRGRCEVRAEYAELLPPAVVASLLGVPRADLPLLRRWSEGFTAESRSGAADPIEAMRLVIEFQHFFAVRIDEARHTPRGDLLSDLGRAREGQRALDLAESLSIVRELLVVAVEPTAAAIADGVRRCAEDTELAHSLRGDPALLPTFVEEVLRLASPTASVARRATRDTELGGIAIAAGTRVELQLGAANRDARTFAAPDRLDLRRANASEHLAFGAGAHACLGAGLARASLTAAIRVLLERVSDLRLAPGPDPTIAFRRTE